MRTYQARRRHFAVESALTRPRRRAIAELTEWLPSSHLQPAEEEFDDERDWPMALNWPLEQEGSKGENVRSIQYLLNERLPQTAGTTEPGTTTSRRWRLFGRRSETESVSEAPASTATATAAAAPLEVDGDFGPKTTEAVRAFQAGHKLTVDGKVGNQTWPELIIEVRSGSKGNAVRAVQSQIRSRSGWLTIDGIFGAETESAVRSFQSFCHLSIDGIVGPNTWNALTLAWLRANSGQGAAELVYQAWTKNDRAAAGYEAIPAAVDMLFARTWDASAGWTFGGCQVSAGTFACTWTRPGDKLILEGNNSQGAPFYYVNNVASEI
jgi:peptidoglycan hydrolase-like protein with peptidoglycan-binding domain